MYEKRVSLRQMLINAYDSTVANEIGFAESDVHIHLGNYDSEIDPVDNTPFPQITITGVGGEGEPYGMASASRGTVYRYDGLIDITAWTGSYQTSNVDDPQRLGSDLANFVRDTVHQNQEGIPDRNSTTGETLTSDMRPLTHPFTVADTDYNPPRYFTTVTVGFSEYEDPPA